MLRANNAEELVEIERYLTINVPTTFDNGCFPIHGGAPAPQVEFDIRHAREHLEKLKFNWLELHTKSRFLTALSSADEWRACQTTKWTPGELKQLEREIDPSKSKLKMFKGQTVELQRRLAEACENIDDCQETVIAKHSHAVELVKELQAEQKVLEELHSLMPKSNFRSIDELQTLLDEQSINLEKKISALERQKNAINDLERLLVVNQNEDAKLHASLSELEAKKTFIMEKKSGVEEKTLSSLCQWYATLCEAVGRMTGGCRIELVRSDYLVATLTSGTAMVPVHLYIEAVSGRLRAVKVGVTSNTPKRQWRDLIEAAIEYNDIPFLLRSVSLNLRALNGNPITVTTSNNINNSNNG